MTEGKSLLKVDRIGAIQSCVDLEKYPFEIEELPPSLEDDDQISVVSFHDGFFQDVSDEDAVEFHNGCESKVFNQELSSESLTPLHSDYVISQSVCSKNCKEGCLKSILSWNPMYRQDKTFLKLLLPSTEL